MQLYRNCNNLRNNILIPPECNYYFTAKLKTADPDKYKDQITKSFIIFSKPSLASIIY